MIDNVLARLLLWVCYRSRSLATNVRQFNAAVAAIEAMIATTPEPTLRGRRPVPPLPGIAPIMRGWSAFMTIHHCNDMHEALLELIPQLEAGHEPDVGDISRLDSRGAHAMLAFHPQLHVPQIRRSIEINC
jgi:hypothetical protein